MKNLAKSLVACCFISLVALLTGHTTAAQISRNPNPDKLTPITTTVSQNQYDSYASVTVNGKQVGRKDGTAVLDVPNWRQTKISIRTKSGKLGSCSLPKAASAGTTIRIYYGRAGNYIADAGDNNSCAMQTVAPPKAWR